MPNSITEVVQNIYLVEYTINIESGLWKTWCQEKVRCIAYDEYLAISKVTNWAMTTAFVWWKPDDENLLEMAFPVTEGTRSVTIKSVTKYANDVGELLRQVPLPEVFPNED